MISRGADRRPNRFRTLTIHRLPGGPGTDGLLVSRFELSESQKVGFDGNGTPGGHYQFLSSLRGFFSTFAFFPGKAFTYGIDIVAHIAL